MLLIEVMRKQYSPGLPCLASLECYSLCADVLIKTKLTVDRGICLEVFSKKGIFENLTKLRKTPLLESLFNKIPGLQPGTSLKRGSCAGAFL